MKYSGVYGLQLLHRERISLFQNILGAVVLVISINILEINGMSTWLHPYFDAFITKTGYITDITFGKCGHQNVAHIQVADGVREIKGCSPGHMLHCLSGNYFIRCNMPYATDIVHEIMVKGAR